MTRLHVTGTDAYGNPKSEIWNDEPVIIWRACSTQCGPLHCAVEPRTLAMCPMHTRCRIVRVMRKRRDALTPTERRRRAAAGIDGPLPQDLK